MKAFKRVECELSETSRCFNHIQLVERTLTAAAVADAAVAATATVATAAVGSFVLRIRYKPIKEVYTMCYMIYNLWLYGLYFRKGLHKNCLNILK